MLDSICQLCFDDICVDEETIIVMAKQIRDKMELPDLYDDNDKCVVHLKCLIDNGYNI